MQVRIPSAITEPAPGVGAGISAMLALFWNLHVVLIFGLVIGAGLFDLWTGSRRARLSREFDRERLDEGIESKLILILSGLFLGLTIDLLVMLGVNLTGVGEPLGFAVQTFTPVTAGILGFILVRECASILDNLDNTPGTRGGIWPGAKRIVDTIRWNAKGNEGTPPEERWDDDLSPAQRRQVEEYIHQMRLPAPQEEA